MKITDWFVTVSPDDPVRYDFSLTRLGMKSPDALDKALAAYGSGGDALS